MANIGQTEIDFGAFPGSNEASVTITGQSSILTTSSVEAFIMADDSTTQHTASDHKYLTALVGLSCSSPTAGSGFTIHARSLEKLQGTFKIRWVWAD